VRTLYSVHIVGTVARPRRPASDLLATHVTAATGARTSLRRAARDNALLSRDHVLVVAPTYATLSPQPNSCQYRSVYTGVPAHWAVSLEKGHPLLLAGIEPTTFGQTGGGAHTVMGM
jgi:hypothetical protein